ncbi:YceI family protein [Maribacter algarum]|nr:YceI family protein [Maribacter algarum]
MKKILALFLFFGFSMVGLAQDSYNLSSESKLTIDGTSTAHSWTVSANKMEGNLMQQNESLIAINFKVAVADIISERGAAMDKKMHAALKKEEHPKVSFVFEQLKNTSTLFGALTIAGMTKNVEITAEIASEGNTMNIKGGKKIVLQDFGIEPPSAMFGQIVVGDEVNIKFDLVFKKG